MTTYILNVPLITAAGTYRYAPITAEEAKPLLQEGFVSAVGHEATARYLSALVGASVPARCVTLESNPSYLPFFLNQPLTRASKPWRGPKATGGVPLKIDRRSQQ